MPVTTDNILTTALQSLLNKVTVQERAYAWEQSTFDHPDQALLAKLCEEFTELCDELEHSGDAERIKDECADVLLILMMFAQRFNFDILAAASNKLAINLQRKWEKREDGLYQHVPEGSEAVPDSEALEHTMPTLPPVSPPDLGMPVALSEPQDRGTLEPAELEDTYQILCNNCEAHRIYDGICALGEAERFAEGDGWREVKRNGILAWYCPACMLRDAT